MPPRARLWAEFLIFYIAVPVAVAVALPPRWMFPVLFAVTAAGLVLLHVTRGFHWYMTWRAMPARCHGARWRGLRR